MPKPDPTPAEPDEPEPVPTPPQDPYEAARESLKGPNPADHGTDPTPATGETVFSEPSGDTPNQ